jgi:hypothetical protein
MEVFMSGRPIPAPREPYHPPARGSSDPYRRPNTDIQKIIGAALAVVGGLFTLYGAGAGISKLVDVSLNNFGLLCIAGTINFVFWTCLAFPWGGLVANSLCTGLALMAFSGIPAIPGVLIAGTGAIVYFKA